MSLLPAYLPAGQGVHAVLESLGMAPEAQALHEVDAAVLMVAPEQGTHWEQAEEQVLPSLSALK